MGITLKNNKPVTKNMTIKGDDGVGIKTITSGTPVITEEKTTTPITVTLTDETTQNFNVEAQNGSGAGNALTKPTIAPSAAQIVAVDNTNTQTMLNIGDGLSVEDGSLKASGSGSPSFFRHHIGLDTQAEVLGTKFSISFDFINNSQTQITKTNFFSSIDSSIDSFRSIATGMFFQMESSGQSTKRIVAEIKIQDSFINIIAFDPNSSDLDLTEYGALDEDSIGYTAVTLTDYVSKI